MVESAAPGHRLATDQVGERVVILALNFMPLLHDHFNILDTESYEVDLNSDILLFRNFCL